jgi:hypothetical protein
MKYMLGKHMFCDIWDMEFCLEPVFATSASSAAYPTAISLNFNSSSVLILFQVPVCGIDCVLRQQRTFNTYDVHTRYFFSTLFPKTQELNPVYSFLMDFPVICFPY